MCAHSILTLPKEFLFKDSLYHFKVVIGFLKVSQIFACFTFIYVTKYIYMQVTFNFQFQGVNR